MLRCLFRLSGSGKKIPLHFYAWIQGTLCTFFDWDCLQRLFYYCFIRFVFVFYDQAARGSGKITIPEGFKSHVDVTPGDMGLWSVPVLGNAWTQWVCSNLSNSVILLLSVWLIRMVLGPIWVHLPIFKVAHSTNAVSHWIAPEVGVQECARHQSCATPSQLLETANTNICPS